MALSIDGARSSEYRVSRLSRSRNHISLVSEPELRHGMAELMISGAYPLIAALMDHKNRNLGGYNLGGIKCVPLIYVWSMTDTQCDGAATRYRSFPVD
jgi:hypothetical protein